MHDKVVTERRESRLQKNKLLHTWHGGVLPWSGFALQIGCTRAFRADLRAVSTGLESAKCFAACKQVTVNQSKS